MSSKTSAFIAGLQEREGYRVTPYRDSLGFWTVAWGHNIHDESIPADLTTVGELLGYLSDRERHKEWFIQDVREAVKGGVQFAGSGWKRLNRDQREAVVEMCFQLGLTKLLKFKKFRAHLQAGDHRQARMEMLDSRWATQTPTRAEYLADKYFSIDLELVA